MTLDRLKARHADHLKRVTGNYHVFKGLDGSRIVIHAQSAQPSAQVLSDAVKNALIR